VLILFYTSNVVSQPATISVMVRSCQEWQVSIQTHLAVDEDEWPPNHPKTFIPLLLLHHQHERTLGQLYKFQKQSNKAVLIIAVR